MKTKAQALKYFVICIAMVSAPSLSAESATLTKNSDDQYLFHPDKSKQTDFNTDVQPLHEASLQGFDCMDADRDRRVSKREFNIWNEMRSQQN